MNLATELISFKCKAHRSCVKSECKQSKLPATVKENRVFSTTSGLQEVLIFIKKGKILALTKK